MGDSARFLAKSIGAIISIFLLIAASASGYDDLYRIVISTESDAKLASSMNLHPILKDENTYLVVTSGSTFQELRRSGFDIEIVEEDFHPSDWRIAISPQSHVMKSNLNSTISQSAFHCTDNFCLVRSVVKDALAMTDETVAFIGLPERALPMNFDRAQPHLAPTVNATLDSIVYRVSEDSLRSYVQRLEQFRSRYTYSDSILAARDWLVDKFKSFGCEVSLDTFETGHSDPRFAQAYNVVADHKGDQDSDIQIVLGAHYDSYSNSLPNIAPGADDNASGTAFCLEIARVLQGSETAKSIRFICFSSEEQWMVGSGAYADEHASDNIELMINADMIGYNVPSTTEYVLVGYQTASSAYGLLVASFFEQYTDLVQQSGGWGPSDHIPFYEHGFKTLYVHEYEFNTPHYHMTHDLSVYLDFQYMRDIVRAFAATAYTTAQAPAAVESLVVIDPGIGGTLLVDWSAVRETREFRYQIHVGQRSGDYDSLIDIPPEQTEATLSGLVDGRTYYIALGTVVDDTIHSVYLNEVTGIPLSLPLPPVEVQASPAYKGIALQWGRSPHRDIVGYRVYRSVDDQTPSLVQSVHDTAWVDTNTLRDSTYNYSISAVDADAHESIAAQSNPSRAAYFDRGLLVIDDQSDAAAEIDSIRSRYDRMFGDIRYDSARSADGITKELLGQYNSVIWLGDLSANLYRCGDALSWYSEWGGNMVFIGVFAGQTFAMHLSDEGSRWFGIRSFEQDVECGLTSGAGLPGWPDALPDTGLFASTFNGLGTTDKLCYIDVYDIDTAVATPIYIFESGDPMSSFDGKICGMYSQRDTSFLAMIGLPVYCLEMTCGHAILSKLADMLGASRFPGGDTNHDTRHTLSDAIRMIGALFRNQWTETDQNLFDVNSDCTFDIIDVQYMLNYMYAGGPPPRYGCADY